MADLDDITGWKEELRAQQETGRIGPAVTTYRHIDYETLKTLVGFFLRDPELRASVISQKYVDAKYPLSFDADNPPEDIPPDRTLYWQFFRWFCWKTDDLLRASSSDIAIDLAYAFISSSTEHFDLDLFPELAEFHDLMRKDGGFTNEVHCEH